MNTQKCERCRCEEYIPTHQFVKFDDKVSYVCKKCWDRFRRWFFTGPKDLKNVAATAGATAESAV